MTSDPEGVIQVSHTAPLPLQDADRAAQAAAEHAAVVVSEVGTASGLKAVEQLFQLVWEADRDRPPITSDVLRALVHSGSYVAAAQDAAGRIVGAGVGFLATDVRAGNSTVDSLHSHIAAVAPGSERRGIGSALKLHQRHWALRHGLRSITWTFDPLVRRNAAFNAHLGAEFVRYYPDFYGEMLDGRNAGHGSDRMLARWNLEQPTIPRTAPDPPAGHRALLDRDADDRPVTGPAQGRRAWVATPTDIERLRRTDPALAHTWRLAVRQALHPNLPQWRIDAFSPAGHYLLVREHETD